MPKPSKNEAVKCAYFTWRLVCRSGMWYADGRSNIPNAGRQSLGAKDKREVCSDCCQNSTACGRRTLGLRPVPPQAC